ncbi:MAG: eukaryotic-like serine/threonine-protein kinase, partial [Solirubrobacteraceae bacterium]|nr:eukaryotic-like serine/threonine-protein kinase [Solirubrobacteraceae bacterium]
TLAYMAPEQSEGLEVGEEADLYSLALVLYEALCGVNPVRGPSPAATARRIGRRLEPLERRRTELPRGLTRALDTALEPAPVERGTLGELTLALQVAHEQLHGSPPRTPRPRHRLQSTARAPAHAPATRSAPPPIEPEAEEQPAEARQGDEGQPSARPARGALPRPVWIALVCATVIWLAASGRPGVALLAIAAALPLLALPIGPRARSATPAWLACALAPMLGVVGLAGVFPAIAGQAARWRERAAAGALGYWWLALAEPLVGRRLWLGPPSGVPAHAAWEGSLGLTATHVIAPTLTLGVLMGAALWGAAAVCLPWLVRGRHALLDALCAVIWTVIIAVAAPAVDAGLAAHATHPSPRGAVLGAVLAALFAVAARALRGPV